MFIAYKERIKSFFFSIDVLSTHKVLICIEYLGRLHYIGS